MKRPDLLFLAAMALALTAASDGPAAQVSSGACPARANRERPWLDTGLTPECRAGAFVAQLKTMDEKLAAVSGPLEAYGLYTANGGDGPAGPANAPGVLALPNPLTLAASFDPDLATAYGSTVGHEFRAQGDQHMLGPTIDIARTWRAGRIPESYGEDPYLQARIAAPYIKAVQAQGVAVTLKHFAIYAQEQGRTGDLPFGERPAVNNIVSERVMREIYLPSFEAAVTEGGAMNVMCSFPRVNGVYACENPFLLNILKSEWGMRGSVAPDFPDAQRSVIAAVNAGLDSGNFGATRAPAAAADGGPPVGAEGLGAALGGSGVPGGVTLKTAVESGKVSPARLDDMIRRRLIPLFAVGAGGASPAPKGTAADAQGLATALRTAESGAVLLRNEHGILPFSPAVKSVAIIGEQAGPKPRVTTEGSSWVPPIHLTSALDAIRARAGSSVAVTYAEGSQPLGELPPIPATVFKTPTGVQGLEAAYYANPNLNFTGAPIATRVEAGVNLPGPPRIAGLPGNNGWSVVWTGTLTPRVSGAHDFSIAGSASGRLFIDGKLVSHFDRVDFGAVSHARVTLKAGQPVKIRVEYTPREAAPIPAMHMLGTTLGTMMALGWAEPNDRIAKAVDAARKADVAVVFVGDGHGEGADRDTLRLSEDQNALIEAVAAANPRTVVVLSTAGAVAMPWASRVSGILETWYAGDMYGQAVSRLLFGDASPQGRLPLTFPRDETQGPATKARNYPGLNGPDGSFAEAYFDEGLEVGYRWYDAHKQTPLYPFGFGLTYSAMPISGVSVAAQDGVIHVKATVRNAGVRDDAQVVQVYAGVPAAGEPPQRLVGFQKVILKPGESRTVDIVVPAKSLRVWDERVEAWRTPKGAYRIMVGRSSRDVVFAGMASL
jgi:beta-glucosidase